jgi:hypothetical protein
VVDTSACPPNFHIESDVNDFHVYRPVPEQIASWRGWTTEWIAHPSATYTPFGDGAARGSEPMLVSEFGLWGLPDHAGLLDESGREPWWFVTGADHSEGIVVPAGVRERFDAWALAAVFGSFEGFVRASQEHQAEGLKLQIEDLRSHTEIGGYVITELTDVHWEANGLLDMPRRPKAGHERLAAVNAPNVVLIRASRTRYRAGEAIVADLNAVGVEGHVNGEIEWSFLGLDGRAPSGSRIEIVVPGVPRPTRAKIEARWIADGRPVATTDVPVWVFPADGMAPTDHVAVTTRWSDVEAVLGTGGRAVIVAVDENALPTGAAVRLEPFAREDDASSGSVYGNGWIMSTGMGWISPPLSERLAIGPALDLAFDGLTPAYVLDGYGPDDREDVFAGHYLGWLHRVRATVAGFSYGRGAGIVCTFPILPVDRDDPLAGALLDRAVQLAGAASFAPRKRL